MILKRLFIIITEELVLNLEHYIIVFVISYVYLIANEKHFFSLIWDGAVNYTQDWVVEAETHWVLVLSQLSRDVYFIAQLYL